MSTPYISVSASRSPHLHCLTPPLESSPAQHFISLSDFNFSALQYLERRMEPQILVVKGLSWPAPAHLFSLPSITCTLYSNSMEPFAGSRCVKLHPTASSLQGRPGKCHNLQHEITGASAGPSSSGTHCAHPVLISIGPVTLGLFDYKSVFPPRLCISWHIVGFQYMFHE